MKNKFIILILCLFSLSVVAENRLVYLFYDSGIVGNKPKLRKKIKEVCSISDDVILFYNGNFYKGTDLIELLDENMFLEHSAQSITINDEIGFNTELVEKLGEVVNRSRLLGTEDDNWEFWVISHEESSSLESICRLIDVNQLEDRIVVKFLLYDDKGDSFVVKSYEQVVSEYKFDMLNF